MPNETNTYAHALIIDGAGVAVHKVILHGNFLGCFRRDRDHLFRADPELARAMGVGGDRRLGTTLAEACHAVRTAFGMEPSAYRGPQ